jgi:cytoskeletal protein CcmA (bactofilin family)
MDSVSAGGWKFMISKDQKTALPGIDNQKSADLVDAPGTVIANDTRIKGTITCRDQILVAGVVEGDIDCGGIVWVAKKGKIYANVYARKVIIEGEINGNIESAEYVEVKSEGRLIGNLKAAKIRMAPGCYFDGEVTMR